MKLRILSLPLYCINKEKTMTVLELQAQKDELVRNILNVNDEEIINRMSRLFKNLTREFPCQHTEEEVIDSMNKAIDAYEKGEMHRFKTLDEIKRKH